METARARTERPLLIVACGVIIIVGVVGVALLDGDAATPFALLAKAGALVLLAGCCCCPAGIAIDEASLTESIWFVLRVRSKGGQGKKSN